MRLILVSLCFLLACPKAESPQSAMTDSDAAATAEEEASTPKPMTVGEADLLFVQAGQFVAEGKLQKAVDALAKILNGRNDGRAERAERFLNEIKLVGSTAKALAVEHVYQGGVPDLSEGLSLLVFWEKWCPHCTREVPKLEAFHKKYEGSIKVVGLTKQSRGVSDEDIKTFIEENQLTYPILKETGQSSSDYLISGIPAAALVKEGVVIWRGHPARLTDALLESFVVKPVPSPLVVPEIQRPPAEAPSLEVTAEEEGALALYQEAADLLNTGRAMDAKAKFMELVSKYPNTSYAERVEKRDLKELTLVGASARAVEVAHAYQGAMPDLASGVSVLVFWETWCPYCRKEMPSIEDLHKKYGDRINVVGLTKQSKGTSDEEVKTFIQDNGLTYPILKETGQASADYAVSGIPAAAVVKDGVVIWRGHPARFDDAMLEFFLAAD